MTVRPATPDDAAAIADLQLRTWLAAYSAFVDPEVMLERSEDRAERWRAILLDGGAFTLVAEAAGELGGFASWGPSRDRDAHPSHPPVGELYALYVAPEAQRAGVGTALQSSFLDDLWTAGFGDVTLWVFAENAPGRAFFEHAGWRPDTGRAAAREDDWAPSVRYRRGRPA